MIATASSSGVTFKMRSECPEGTDTKYLGKEGFKEQQVEGS